MSVLIEGMDIPKNCYDCEFLESGTMTMYRCCLTNKTFEFINNKRHEGCPLIEIPEQHGNLIDVDACINELEFRVKIAKQIARYDTERAKDMHNAIIVHAQIISELENREVIIKREE